MRCLHLGHDPATCNMRCLHLGHDPATCNMRCLYLSHDPATCNMKCLHVGHVRFSLLTFHIAPCLSGEDRETDDSCDRVLHHLLPPLHHRQAAGLDSKQSSIVRLGHISEHFFRIVPHILTSMLDLLLVPNRSNHFIPNIKQDGAVVSTTSESLHSSKSQMLDGLGGAGGNPVEDLCKLLA